MKQLVKTFMPLCVLFIVLYGTLVLYEALVLHGRWGAFFEASRLIVTVWVVGIYWLSIKTLEFLWYKLKKYRQYQQKKPEKKLEKLTPEKALDTPCTFLVTGANRGIGLALTRQLRLAGHKVIALARDINKSDELRSLTEDVFTLDTTDISSIDKLARQLHNVPIDCIINNATIAPSNERLGDINIDHFASAFQTNVVGALRLIQQLQLNLAQSRMKKVINISSDLGSFQRQNPCLLYGYQTSKAALNMLTVLLDKELKQAGFTCLAIHPGSVKTRLNIEGLLSTDESAKAIIALIYTSSITDGGKWLDYNGESVPW